MASKQTAVELIEVKTIVDQSDNRHIAKEIYHEIEGFVIHITIEPIDCEMLTPNMRIEISKLSDKNNKFNVFIDQGYKEKAKLKGKIYYNDYYSRPATDLRTAEEWTNVCRFANHAKGLLDTLKKIENL